MPLPRQSGILLHPSSLPGPHGAGDLGAAAYHFVDWLAALQRDQGLRVQRLEIQGQSGGASIDAVLVKNDG